MNFFANEMGFFSMKKYMIGLFLTVALTLSADVKRTVTQCAQYATAVQVGALAGLAQIAYSTVSTPLVFFVLQFCELTEKDSLSEFTMTAGGLYVCSLQPRTVLSLGACIGAAIGIEEFPGVYKETFDEVSKMDLIKEESYSANQAAVTWVGAASLLPSLVAGLLYYNRNAIVEVFKS